LGGVIYVLIVLIVLSLAIPLAQAANFFVGLLYDTVIILMAASRSTEEESEAAVETASGGGGGGGGGGGASAKVRQAKEDKKKEDKKKDKKQEEKQTKRLASVFSRSRNKGKSGAGPSNSDAGGRDGKPAEWPNKPPTELATQRDVNMAVVALQRAVAGLTGKDEVNNRRQFAIIAKTLYDLRFIRYEALRSFTIEELAKVRVDLERLRDIEVAGLRGYATKSIADVRGLITELQRQNGGGGGAVLSRRNRPPSTNPFDASAARSGVFGALAERAQAWFASHGRGAYDEVSPASEDDDFNDEGGTSNTAGDSSTVVHHVFDVGDARHGPSPSEKSTMERLGGVLPPV
jgi:hypothetical protein